MDCDILSNLWREEDIKGIYKELNKRTGYYCKYNGDINEKYIYGYTILVLCIVNNCTDLVERCIKLGADIECKDYYGRTPLFWTLRNTMSTDIAEILLKAGANPNIKIKDANYDEYPLFMWIMWDDHYVFNAKFNLLLKYGLLLNEYSKYKEMIDTHNKHYISNFIIYSTIAKRRWVYLKTVVKILSLHKRAVITANHPDRLLEQGYFQLEI